MAFAILEYGVVSPRWLRLGILSQQGERTALRAKRISFGRHIVQEVLDDKRKFGVFAAYPTAEPDLS
jgi:hypothetical protein